MPTFVEIRTSYDRTVLVNVADITKVVDVRGSGCIITLRDGTRVEGYESYAKVSQQIREAAEASS